MRLAALFEHPLGRISLESLPFWQMMQDPTEGNVLNGVIATGSYTGAAVSTDAVTRYGIPSARSSA